MSTAPLFDTYQQVFALSGLSNRAADIIGSPTALQNQLQYELGSYLTNTNLKYEKDGGFVPSSYPMPIAPNAVTDLTDNGAVAQAIGVWELVWGPVVWSNKTKFDQPDGKADNAIFVAYNPSVTFPGNPAGPMPTYVVAIAATNPLSTYDWDSEDFDVGSAVAWTEWKPNDLTKLKTPIDPSNPVISYGTANGVSKLLAMSPLPTAVGTGTLAEFLASDKIVANAMVVFTGHSLAGALSPTTALYLKQSGALKQFANSLVYPTAGATPGNAAFVSQFAEAFPVPVVDPQTLTLWTIDSKAPYQAWNTLLWNQYDIVPHSWNTSPAVTPNLTVIPALYMKGQPPLTVIQEITNAAVKRSTDSGAVYVHTANASLPGTLQTGKSLNVPPTDLIGFLDQAYIQHIAMYFGIDGDNGFTPGVILTEKFPKIVMPNLPGIRTVKQNGLHQLANMLMKWIAGHV